MNDAIRTIDEYYSRMGAIRAIGNPKCSTVTGDAWKLELVDEPPEFLRQCKNCERIMRS